MKEFKDLEFKNHPTLSGIQAKMFFENGFGVSVVKSPLSYGGEKGLFELAVVKGTEEDWDLDYTLEVCKGDVLGHLTEQGVSDAMVKVQNEK